MRPLRLGWLLVGLLFLGTGVSPARAQVGAEPAAVVALIDTGINPYHRTFRDDSPRALQHPSTYIPGYPADAIALHVSLDEPDYATAVSKDCQNVWAKVERGKLYWFPGTKIVGGITLGSPFTNCQFGVISNVILDTAGHGTMTASRAASVEYGACRECLVVSVQGFGGEQVEWAGANAAWIDVQSNSWGPTTPLWEPVGLPSLVAANPQLVRTIEAAARAHLAFWSSGNGAVGRLGVLGHPTVITARLTPSVVMVGGHDSGYVTLWHGFSPHVVSDSCSSWAAHFNSTTTSADNVGGGTSGAAPFAAGGAARILLEARRILGDSRTGVDQGVVATGPGGLVPAGPIADGVLTVAEWRDVVFKTATPRPARQFEDGSVCGPDALNFTSTPVRWVDVPAEYPEFVNIGYGAVDPPSVRLAFSVLRGEVAIPGRPATDDYFSRESVVRQALHQVFSTGPP